MSEEMHSVRCTNDNDLGKDSKHCERNSNRHPQAEQIHFLRYDVWEVSQLLIWPYEVTIYQEITFLQSQPPQKKRILKFAVMMLILVWDKSLTLNFLCH